MHNVDFPENSLHSTQPFAEGVRLQGAVQGHPPPGVPHSQQLLADMVRFGERILRHPKLLQPSSFPPADLMQLAFPLVVLMSRRSLWVKRSCRPGPPVYSFPQGRREQTFDLHIMIHAFVMLKKA